MRLRRQGLDYVQRLVDQLRQPGIPEAFPPTILFLAMPPRNVTQWRSAGDAGVVQFGTRQQIAGQRRTSACHDKRKEISKD
ncbi:hypothetical protein [Georgfuchsia toluolica]|uniref:hypothetical protein n=1 Tax=Georgfuchsia toluolica TaxID=424218 RepID=UPI001C73C865|nr:hypothetical protein [Georgfuchsia toluolica]